MTTTPDPASPVAAALADAAVAEMRANAAMSGGHRAAVWFNREGRPDVLLLAAHIRTLAARDAEQTARMAALTEAAGAYLDSEFPSTDYIKKRWALCVLLADADAEQRERGDDE